MVSRSPESSLGALERPDDARRVAGEADVVPVRLRRGGREVRVARREGRLGRSGREEDGGGEGKRDEAQRRRRWV